MALIHCPECNHEISDKSKVCVNCGYPINDETYKKKNAAFTHIIIYCFLVIIVIMLGFVIVMLGKIGKQQYSYKDNNELDIQRSDDSDVSISESYVEADTVESQIEEGQIEGLENPQKTDLIYWSSDDNNIALQTDDIYITTDSNGNYGIVAKFTLFGASEEKAEIPLINVYLCQNGKRYIGPVHSTHLNQNMADSEALYNMTIHDDYLNPPDNGYPGSCATFPIAQFMPIASYDLEDEFQICIAIGPGKVTGSGPRYSEQYMVVDNLQVR